MSAHETSDPTASWMPVTAGTRLVYTQKSVMTATLEGQAIERHAMSGDRIDEFKTVPDSEQVVVSSTIRMLPESGEQGSIERSRSWLSSNGRGVDLHAVEKEWGGKRRMFRARAPIALLREGRPGVSWKAGFEIVDGMQLERVGEVLGVQDVTAPAGSFEKCVVVRYTSTLKKPFTPADGEGTTVTAGRIVRTEWYVPAMGLVLSRETSEMDLTGVSGSGKMKTSTQATLYQAQQAYPAEQSAPPANAAGAEDSSWATGDWKLTYDPDSNLAEDLPVDWLRFSTAAATVGLANATRTYLECPFEIRGDRLILNCQVKGKPKTLQLIATPERKILLNNSGAQYTRQ